MHKQGPIPYLYRHYYQFNKIKYGKTWTISIFRKDNTIILEGYRVCVVKNIISTGEDCCLVVQQFQEKKDLYNLGLASSSCGEYLCSLLSEEVEVVPLNQVKSKCFRMPHWDQNTATNIAVPNVFFVSTITSTHQNSD